MNIETFYCHSGCNYFFSTAWSKPVASLVDSSPKQHYTWVRPQPERTQNCLPLLQGTLDLLIPRILALGPQHERRTAGLE